MADRPTFTEIIVGQLGQPKEPFGWGDLLGLIAVAAALAAYLALEYGLGTLIVRLFRRILPEARPSEGSAKEE